MTGKVMVVVGGQFGSEAKGEVAGWLARSYWRADRPLVAVRVAGPNSGHTVTEHGSMRLALRQVPVAAVTHPRAELVIAAGSEVDLDVLHREVDGLDQMGCAVSGRLTVDPQATLIDRYHQDAEAQMAQFGWSTGKGIGAARAARALRQATIVGPPGDTWSTSEYLRDALWRGSDVLIEGTQGYGLGSHTHYYPKVTSSDCRAVDFLAMAGVSPWAPEVESVEIWVVIRNRAIRIAGDSGPLPQETTWEELGVKPEYTTVTKKIRRVGGFLPELVRRAIHANGGPGPNVKVALTHLDHEIIDGDQERKATWLAEREAEIESPIHMASATPGAFSMRPNRGWGRTMPPATTFDGGLKSTSTA